MKENKNLEEKFAAYVSGCMNPEEKTNFEKRLEQDQNLKHELQSYIEIMNTLHQWNKIPPPGIDRVLEITPPVLDSASPQIIKRPSHDKTKIHRIFNKHVFAAAALFILGYFIGNITPFAFFKGNNKQGAQKQTQYQTLPNKKQASHQTPAPTRTPAPLPQQGKILRRVTRQNGKIVIETSRTGIDTNTIWIVDSSLRIADASLDK